MAAQQAISRAVEDSIERARSKGQPFEEQLGRALGAFMALTGLNASSTVTAARELRSALNELVKRGELVRGQFVFRVRMDSSSSIVAHVDQLLH